jgi:hypothetical protein
MDLRSAVAQVTPAYLIAFGDARSVGAVRTI